jgi:uncharacterized membrane protein YGL010W
MMIRKNLHSWQHQSYGHFHGSRLNIVLHLLSVPLFWAGIGVLFSALLLLSWQRFLLGFLLLLVPVIIQGIGHKQEKNAPIPFLGPSDFFSRFLMEQLVTFPRWIAERISKS